MPARWTQKPVDAPDDDFLSIEEVGKLFGFSGDTVQRLIDAGEFPEGLQVTKQSKAWDWRAVAYYRLKLELASRLNGLKKVPQPEGNRGQPRGNRGQPDEGDGND